MKMLRHCFLASCVAFVVPSFAQGAAPSVGVIIAKPEKVVLTENLPARLEASREAIIQPQVSGIVQKRLFVEGAEVKAGEQLYQIDDAVYQANLLSAKAQLAQAKANRDLADTTAKRYAPLVKERAISRQTYDQAVAEVKVAEANIMSAEAAIRQAEINLEYTKVNAPISGIIGRSLVSEGALVTTSGAEMATIQQIDPIYVNISQLALDVLSIQKAIRSGEMAGVDLNVKVTLDNGEVYPYEGKLLFADLTVSESTGDLLVRAQVPNPDSYLLPGMYVRVDVPRSQYQEAYLIPQGAITRGRVDTLRVVNSDGSFASREVKVVGSKNNHWVVSEGLQAGEMVMVESLSQLASRAEKVTPVILNDDEAQSAQTTGE